MGDRQEVPSSPSNETSSSSRAIPAGTKRSADQDAEDLRHGDNESPRIGTKRDRDPDDREDGDGMLIVYTVDEEADLDKFFVGFQGIVDDHCDDDDVSGEIKKGWADLKDTDTDDMSCDAVYDDISGQQLDGTLVSEARMRRARRFEQHGSLGRCGQGRVLPEDWEAAHSRTMGRHQSRALTRAQCIDPSMLLNSCDVSMEATQAKSSSRQCHPRRPSRRYYRTWQHAASKVEVHESFYSLTSPRRTCTRQ